VKSNENLKRGSILYDTCLVVVFILLAASIIIYSDIFFDVENNRGRSSMLAEGNLNIVNAENINTGEISME
jgi:hypothetical protein